jgi:hypothetical protein
MLLMVPDDTDRRLEADHGHQTAPSENSRFQVQRLLIEADVYTRDIFDNASFKWVNCQFDRRSATVKYTCDLAISAVPCCNGMPNGIQTPERLRQR